VDAEVELNSDQVMQIVRLSGHEHFVSLSVSDTGVYAQFFYEFRAMVSNML